MEGGIDVNQPDIDNVTILHWAAINNRKKIVKYLIAKGAVIDAVGGELNATPLHWATRYKTVYLKKNYIQTLNFFFLFNGTK